MIKGPIYHSLRNFWDYKSFIEDHGITGYRKTIAVLIKYFLVAPDYIVASLGVPEEVRKNVSNSEFYPAIFLYFMEEFFDILKKHHTGNLRNDLAKAILDESDRYPIVAFGYIFTRYSEMRYVCGEEAYDEVFRRLGELYPDVKPLDFLGLMNILSYEADNVVIYNSVDELLEILLYGKLEQQEGIWDDKGEEIE